jgi:hypothetical protein
MSRTFQIVVVVGGDAELASLLNVTLRKQRHEPITVATCQDAIGYAILNAVDAVLVAQPLEDAQTLPVEIRKKCGSPGLPVALLVSSSTPEQTREAFAKQFTIVTNRPEEAAEANRLISVISSIVSAPKRQFARVAFADAVRCSHPGGEFTVQAVNVSVGGMMITFSASRKQLVRTGDTLTVAFTIRGKTVTTSAVVMSVLLTGTASLRFEGLAPEDRDLIHSFVETRRAGSA